MLYEIKNGRSNQEGEAILRSYKGVAVTDSYVVYDSLSTRKGLVLANCSSHARRKFIEAAAGAPDDAGEILDKIGAMFGIETEVDVKEADLSREDALALRSRCRMTRAESRPAFVIII